MYCSIVGWLDLNVITLVRTCFALVASIKPICHKTRGLPEIFIWPVLNLISIPSSSAEWTQIWENSGDLGILRRLVWKEPAHVCGPSRRGAILGQPLHSKVNSGCCWKKGGHLPRAILVWDKPFGPRHLLCHSCPYRKYWLLNGTFYPLLNLNVQREITCGHLSPNLQHRQKFHLRNWTCQKKFMIHF